MRTLIATVAAVVIAVAAVAWAGPPPASAAVKVIDAKKATITIWHGYLAGASEEWAFQTVLASVRPRFPNVTFRVVRLPWFGEMYTRFEADPMHGPDLLVGPNDRLGTQVSQKLLRDVTPAMKSRASSLTPKARAGAMVSGKYRIVPESSKTMGFFFRPSRLTSLPPTTAALLDAVRRGLKFGFLADAYDPAGFYAAFGGRIIDSSYRCVADRTPAVADSVRYLRELVDAGASAYRVGDYYRLQEDFRAGRLDAILDGSWAAADHGTALGADLAVDMLPPGPVGSAQPFVGTDGWFVNAKRSNGTLATKIALALSDRAAQTTMMTSATHVPADSSIPRTDDFVVVFGNLAAGGQLQPVGRAFDAYWVPFRTAIEQVVFDGADATEAIHTACSAMNAANGR
jgi:maltose-binding protein MalE